MTNRCTLCGRFASAAQITGADSPGLRATEVWCVRCCAKLGAKAGIESDPERVAGEYEKFEEEIMATFLCNGCRTEAVSDTRLSKYGQCDACPHTGILYPHEPASAAEGYESEIARLKSANAAFAAENDRLRNRCGDLATQLQAVAPPEPYVMPVAGSGKAQDERAAGSGCGGSQDATERNGDRAKAVPANDPVNRPAHYTWLRGFEVIDLTENLNFCVGNAVKYLLRHGRKDGVDPIEDLHKARWYVDREIQRLERAKDEARGGDEARRAA